MKNNKFFILFALVCGVSFSQNSTNNLDLSKLSVVSTEGSSEKISNFDKWSIEVGTGASVGVLPFTAGYGLSDKNNDKKSNLINRLNFINDFSFNSFSAGATYNFSKFVSLKADLSFDHFIKGTEDTKNPFETVQYRIGFHGQVNVSRLTNLKKDGSMFNVLAHGGLQFARLIPIAADYNDPKKRLSNGDNLVGVVVGITPTYIIFDNNKVFFDLSSFNNFSQDLTWNGFGSIKSNKSRGQMYALTFGLSIGLDKK